MPARLVRHVVTVLLILILSTVLSCSANNRLEGYVYYRLNADPTTLDPALIVDVTGGSISAKIFNGLVKLDEQLNVVPDIAESWKISEDGTTYVFHLRKNVNFSNNREVTSSDFKYSFKRILSPSGRSPNTWVLEKISGAKDFMQGRVSDISGIEIPDPYTVEIKLEQPFSPFLQLLTMTAAYVLPKEEVERLGDDFSSHPVGTGPFLLKEWKHNNQIVLKKNSLYFAAPPKIEGIVYRIIPEDLTAVTEFELGNIDVITVPASEYSRYRTSPEWKEYLSSIYGLNVYYLGFNCSRPPFDNVNLRKAVAYAIDREKILNTFYEKRGRLAQGPVPDILRKWQALFPYAFDLQKARELIDEEAMNDRTILFYITTADQEVIDIAEIIQSYLKEAGLNIKIKQLEWSAYKAAINNGEPDLFWLSWWADYPDPENFLFPLFHSSNHGASGNRSRYTSSEVDRLIEAGQRALDSTARDGYYASAEKIIAEEVPWVFFWHKTDFTLRQPYLKNYKIYPIYNIDKGVEISF
ncbi:MAG: ABC transporter substrate-binding protein [Nitrospirota bacterium]|nr:ABC transporter substrate-binding protein [Nitrospirota bacterium]